MPLNPPEAGGKGEMRSRSALESARSGRKGEMRSRSAPQSARNRRKEQPRGISSFEFVLNGQCSTHPCKRGRDLEREESIAVQVQAFPRPGPAAVEFFSQAEK
ncbi:hypothetical protein PBOR_02390 [Paenibacillus borealis]|uniref:Uncharacterized protein n=1 Tax=Paenibacillus borealis TaxID=160799 RepID=A0A089L9Y3_PAEBO|nr:hypothetical protein PBOR_02390 [Paenibacillus borealis]